MSEAPFSQVTIVGLGLLGGSIGHAVQAFLPGVTVVGYDADPEVREQARALGLAHRIADEASQAAQGSDLVVFCVPVGAMDSRAAKARRRSIRRSFPVISAHRHRQSRGP